MEVASSSSSSSPSSSAPPPSKSALRLNPAAVLLRRLPTPTPSTATPVTASAPAPARANQLVAFLSSLIPWREQQGSPKKQPDPTASAASSSAAAERRAARAAAEAEAEARQLVGCAVPLFRPYVAQLPWHGGARAWLSKLFPRYGHYCGPNWSSGKEEGSVLWDRRPVDHLDFCCYCHDMAYDTHDQAQLLRADLAFLRCLEGSRKTPARDGVAAAVIYRAMCIFGLKTILIPYRTNLVRLQTGPNYADFFADFVKRIASSSGRPTGGEKQRL
ncbi:hypothetical protein HU200_045806 [Digitaria exilis]|uniref:Phospholipase A2 family protein n=1 Tax=Digitaria exilis TaxID=1010633 RepID=A0A835EF46_9POAL|nr:hypothetical protein HU200_045806 [Digitaria exilis]CAB3458844.1 unnamed protein product [Digitaria exilis]